ncbi:hypothetical protein ACFX2I_022355 [Malus domestica]
MDTGSVLLFLAVAAIIFFCPLIMGPLNPPALPLMVAFAMTTGIIELGGASAQVTFVSSEPVPPEFSRAVKFGNVTYNLYSHSFLHFGQNVAYDSLKEGIVSGDFDSGKDTSFAFFIDYMMP